MADAPLERERVQVFNAQGLRIAGFELPSRSLPRVLLDSIVLNGVGSLHFTGRRMLISQPEHGGAITEYDLYGQPQRTIGRLRPTGHEADHELHVALNAAIPLATLRRRRSGSCFRPVCRCSVATTPQARCSSSGGSRAASSIAISPRCRSTWPRRRIDSAGDSAGHAHGARGGARCRRRLWISFVVPWVFEYDEDGDKIGVFQLQAAGPLAPTSLAFGPDRRLFVTPGPLRVRRQPFFASFSMSAARRAFASSPNQ